jgi:hypothetical protein
MEHMETIKYEGHDCVKMTNGTVDLMIPQRFGPRVLFAGFKGGKNMFGVVPDVDLKTPMGLWKIHGGHRLWIAPEIMPDTYYPDNDDVTIEERGRDITVSQSQRKINIKKEMVISFQGKNKVKVVHNVYNTGSQPREFAVWALSLMRTGGFAIVPQSTEKEDKAGFLPNRNLVMWAYTDLADKRFKMTPKYNFVKQGGPKPFKIGQRIPLGWSAYSNGTDLFVKRFKFEAGKTYPDFLSNVEIYSCDKFLEVETISPLMKMDGGSCYTYTETWEFFKDKKIAFGDEKLKI